MRREPRRIWPARADAVPGANGFSDACPTAIGRRPPEQVSAVEAVLKVNGQSRTTIRMCTDFLLNYVFTCMKCFDARRSFEDEVNHYIECESRNGSNVQSASGDVARVFFPASYATRFRADMASYVGQITFID